MTLVDRDVAVETALRAVSPSEGHVVYVDREVREAGTIELGGEQRRLERPALLVFRDQMPGANWMHPCTYALVDLESGELLASVASDRPPVFGPLPDSWVVASDPGGHADLVPR
jgi:hypothetical protein